MRENDIVFFNLHRRYTNSAPNFGGFIGIYILSAFLNNNGYQAQGFAGTLIRGKELLDDLCKNKLISAVGLYCDYDNVTENIFLSNYIKENYDIPVIIGGPQATALKEDFYYKSKCDAVVRYEGELSVLELMDCLLDKTINKEDVKGISFLSEGKLIVNPEREVISNLDSIPFITSNDYLIPELYSRSDSLSIMTGRGCPFHCAFCHEGHHTKKVRFRSIESILKEIKSYIKDTKKKDYMRILFVDDTFTLKPMRVKEICKGIQEISREYNIHISWFCEGHVHTLYEHPEMLDYIVEAGCSRLQLGIESGNQETLNAFRKGSTIEEIEFIVKRCHELGIKEIFSNVILGAANFTRDIFEENKAFAKHLISLGAGMVELRAVTYWPLPETSITDKCDEYGVKIIDSDFLTSAGDFPLVEAKELNRFELHEMVREFNREIINTMKEMIKNNLVPKQIILSWFDKYNMHTGKWYYVLRSMPEEFAYYQMIALGEGITSERIEADVFLSLHPMRLLDVSEYLEIHEDKSGIMCGNQLTEFDIMVYVYSYGKLTVKEIIEKLYTDGYKEQLNVEDYKNKVVNTLRMFEKKHLIIFTRY